MIIVARAIGLVLLGLGMIVLEFRAFSTPWTWTSAQDIFVLVALSILLGALWARRRQLLDSDAPRLSITQPESGRPHLPNLLLWIMIAVALAALFNVLWKH